MLAARWRACSIRVASLPSRRKQNDYACLPKFHWRRMGERRFRENFSKSKSRRYARSGGELSAERTIRGRRGRHGRTTGIRRLERNDVRRARPRAQQSFANPRVAQSRTRRVAHARGRQDAGGSDRGSSARLRHLSLLRRTQLHDWRPDDSARSAAAIFSSRAANRWASLA